MMYCKKCGSELEEDAVFCPSCGYSLKGKSSALSMDPHKLSMKTIVMIVILVVLALVGGVLGFYKYKSVKYKEYRNSVFGTWTTEDNAVITFSDYNPNGNTTVFYDSAIAHKFEGGIYIDNSYYLCAVFSLNHTENTDEKIFIDNDYHFGKKHDLILEIDDSELYIDEISSRCMTISDESGNTLELTKQ